ncbi:MAG: A/G-specific adenine glycosylase [Oscillospiraceae bacterium]|jgi:A/G-specific adenine glycosylase|nr:A/G-specific adenine glycosylase [Oscillospiraceae bacterium]
MKSGSAAEALSPALLDWYQSAKRDLPFRRTRDPYAIWVSEIMAQQTRITALIPYFERFLRAFPNAAALAAADEDDVLKAWEGLGYYSRARCLHRAARLMVSAHGGAVPDDPAALRGLPGIGDYTAGAILSIAFGQKAPAVDGNVLRVHARLTDDPTDIALPAAKETARVWVLSLMGRGDPGAVTEALMELGALVCLPKQPRCEDCPARDLCAARLAGRVGERPVKSPKKPQRTEARPVCLLFDPQGRVLMRRRTESLLRGLWEFPAAPPEGLAVLSAQPCGRHTHVFTHIIWEMEGSLCATAAFETPEGFLWADGETFETLAVPVAFRGYMGVVRGALAGAAQG